MVPFSAGKWRRICHPGVACGFGRCHALIHIDLSLQSHQSMSSSALFLELIPVPIPSSPVTLEKSSMPKAVLSVPVSPLSKSYFHSFTPELCGPNCSVTLILILQDNIIWVNMPSPFFFLPALLPWSCCLNLDGLICSFIFFSHSLSGLFCPIPI